MYETELGAIAALLPLALMALLALLFNRKTEK